MGLMFKRLSVAASNIGGIQATQEVLDLCAKHNIIPDCKTVLAKDIDWCWEQLTAGGNKDGIRYVIDIKKSLDDKSFLPE